MKAKGALAWLTGLVKADSGEEDTKKGAEREIGEKNGGEKKSREKMRGEKNTGVKKHNEKKTVPRYADTEDGDWSEVESEYAFVGR